jgi:cytochrome b6-f complex iron-sulfur subunit
MGVAMLAACASGLPTGPGVSPFAVKLSDYPALSVVGGIAVVDNGSRSGTPIALTRTSATSFVALSLECPHRGVTVRISGSGFFCSGHGATFAGTGSWTGGQHTSGLATYPSRFDETTGTIDIG